MSNIKICSNCKVEKELTEFYFRKDQNKHRTDCKMCRLEKDRIYTLNNRIKEKGILWKKKLKEENKKYCKKCDKIKDRNLFHNCLNKPDGKMSQCKNCRKLIEQNNKEIIKEKRSIWYKKNKIEIIKQHNIYLTNKRKYNTLFKLRCNISARIQQSLKRNGYTKNSKTNQILGCSFEEFKQYLQIQFTKGMTWENFGEWHLDHIYPVSLAKNEEELIRLNHYTNFQPLWAKDNLQKSNKIIHNKQLKLI